MPHARAMAPRPPAFRIDNLVIDHYAAEMGALGLALYAALARYADRQTGECFPSITTLGAKLQLGRTTVKKFLRKLECLGLIAIAPRRTAEGDPTSNLYILLDPAPAAVAARRDRLAASARASGGGPPDDLPRSPDDLPLGRTATHPQSPDDPKQDPGNKRIITSPDPTSKPTRRDTCPHPQPEVVQLADGIVICAEAQTAAPACTNALHAWICSHDTGHMWEAISPYVSQSLEVQEKQA